MAYDPEGPIAKQLTPLLANELNSTFNIPDDAQDTAEYINMMIGQNRSSSEICAEVKEVIDIPIDESFINRVFMEIGRLEQLQNSGAQQEAPQQEPQKMQQEQQQHNIPANVFPPPSQSNPFQQMQQTNPFQPGQPQDNNLQDHTEPSRQFPTGPQSRAKTNNDNGRKDTRVNFSKSTDFKKSAGISKGGKTNGRSGVSKDYTSNGGASKKKSYGMQNASNLQKALALATEDSINMQSFTPKPPKGRCKDFPYCKNKECPYAHATKKCFAYPNCPNPPGTCDYLHPSEDGELMQELEKTKQQYMDRKSQKFAAPQVTLCKYGILCSKELCPFGHPTPANKDAKVIIQMWCRENKNCQNPNCEYAHSSPNYQAPVQRAPPVVTPKLNPNAGYNKYAAKTPTTLEQCKFGWNCTNQSCPKRHATSSVACRDGYSCTRMDCTFNHPIDEDCRFGNECKNSPCFFRHPDGREKTLFTNSFNPSNSTMGRPFAVTEDQVMEHATQE